MMLSYVVYDRIASSYPLSPPPRLVCWQPSYNLRHLLISVDPEALVLGHTSQLHVLAIQLLLHDLLECLEREHLGLGERKRLVEFVLEFGLGALRTGTDGFGVVAVECAGGFGVVAGCC